MVDQNSQPPPEYLKLRDNGRELQIIWCDHHIDTLSAASLRAQCRSATAWRATLDNLSTYPRDVRVTAIEPIGNYGVNIAFSDGEERGIYPWPFLAELARQAAVRPITETMSD